MKDDHIINLLEENKLKDLSEDKTRQIEAHIKECVDCRREFGAAKVALTILRERAAHALEPTPFFEARVMNALRERQATRPVSNRLWQMWQDAKLLVSGLGTSVAMLLILTFVVSQNTSSTDFQATVSDQYSVESIVFDSPEGTENLTDSELIQTIYSPEETEN